MKNRVDGPSMDKNMGGITPPKWLKCNICKYDAKDARDLMDHKRKHTPRQIAAACRRLR